MVVGRSREGTEADYVEVFYAAVLAIIQLLCKLAHDLVTNP